GATAVAAYFFAPPLAAAPFAAGAAAAAVPSAPSSSLAFFFFFFMASLRTRTLGRPRGESPSFHFSVSLRRSRRSARERTLRVLVAPRRTFRLLSIVMAKSPGTAS